MANRRVSLVTRISVFTLSRTWKMIGVAAVALPYLVLVLWLYHGTSGEEPLPERPSLLFSVENEVQWHPPDVRHRLGTTASGGDVLELSRFALGCSMILAVGVALLGTLLASGLALVGGWSRSHRMAALVGRVSGWFVVPGWVALVIIAGGSGGEVSGIFWVLVLLMVCGFLPQWAGEVRQVMAAPDVVVAEMAGVPRSRLLWSRGVSALKPKALCAFLRWIPVLLLVEMALAFMGLSGDRWSCGSLIAHGRQFFVEAPWLVVGPGLLATLWVTALTGLAGLASWFLKPGTTPGM